MAKIRSVEEIAEKYSRVTPARTADYAEGIRAPKKDWKSETMAAEDAWAGGVQAAVADKRFGKGVTKAGTEKWQRKASEVGAPRWGPGVAAAGADYKEGFAPYQAVISATTLPPRGPKGDPRNIERVTRIATALHEKKLAI